jgi:hypothetical protein
MYSPLHIGVQAALEGLFFDWSKFDAKDESGTGGQRRRRAGTRGT